eukprot:1002980-Rhodomonas_salina.1
MAGSDIGCVLPGVVDEVMSSITERVIHVLSMPRRSGAGSAASSIPTEQVGFALAESASVGVPRSVARVRNRMCSTASRCARHHAHIMSEMRVNDDTRMQWLDARTRPALGLHLKSPVCRAAKSFGKSTRRCPRSWETSCPVSSTPSSPAPTPPRPCPRRCPLHSHPHIAPLPAFH